MRKGVVRTARYYASFALDPLGFVRSRFDTYGDIYYAQNKDGGLFVVKHPDHLREVLSTKASSFSKEHTAAGQLRRVLGGGLLLSEGDDWTRQRRIVQPAFAPTRMAGYGQVMLEEAQRTVDQWKARTKVAQASSKDIVALDNEMTALTLRIVSRTLFGHDVAEEDIRTIARAMDAFQSSLSSPDFLPRWMPSPARRALARGLEDLDRIVYRVIEERRSNTSAERADLLQLLVDAVDHEGDKSRLTPREVRDQLVTLFLAGHETTSQALTWAFYCLTQAPEAERRLHEELDRVLGTRAPTVADLEQLPWTDQVLTEAMRLYPPVYAVARRAREDVQIGGFDVPRGSELMAWIYMTHRDPRFYPEPTRFKPERFDKDKTLPKFAYLPFGGGPRACIGKAFAMMEGRLILAAVAQRFRLRLAPGQRIGERPRITLTPKHGMRMRISAAERG